MLQDGVRACAVAAQQLHVNVLPELDQGDRAALPTHVHGPVRPSGCCGSGAARERRTRARLWSAPERCVNSTPLHTF